MKLNEGDFVKLNYTGYLKSNNFCIDTTIEEIAKKQNIFSKEFKYGPVTVCIGKNNILNGIDKNLSDKDEKESFEFFSALAANAEQEDVRQQSENIAAKKLEHIALLRLERKRTWRTNERARLESIVGRDTPLTLASFEETTTRLKTALRRRYLDLATEADPLADDMANNVVNNLTATLLRDLAAEIPDLNGQNAELSSLPDIPLHTDLPAVMRAALRETEAAFDAFMSVAAHAASEDIVDAAQEEAGECVARLERLRDGLTVHISELTF